MLDETTVETHMSKEACHPFDAIGGMASTLQPLSSPYQPQYPYMKRNFVKAHFHVP